MNSKAKITVASIISILSLASFGFSDGHSGETYGPYTVSFPQRVMNAQHYVDAINRLPQASGEALTYAGTLPGDKKFLLVGKNLIREA